MDAFVVYLTARPWLINLIFSVALVIAALLLRWGLRRSINIAAIPSLELRRRWVIWIRAFTIILIAGGLCLIWSTELHTMAISIAAFIVALVISFKELIACITGSALKIGAHSFTLGDRISVSGMRGDVIDQTLLATTIMEVGPGATASQYTGRSVTVPNSLFLTNPIIRESPVGGIALCTLVIPARVGDDLPEAEAVLLTTCGEVTADYMARARRAAEQVLREHAIEPPSVEPRVTWSLVDPDRVDLLVRFPAPVDRRRDVEQKILKRYVEHRSATIERETREKQEVEKKQEAQKTQEG